MNGDELIAALDLPESARVNKRVPKTLLVEHGAPTAADKRRINEGIEELRWLAVLKPTTVGVPAMPKWGAPVSRPRLAPPGILATRALEEVQHHVQLPAEAEPLDGQSARASIPATGRCNTRILGMVQLWVTLLQQLRPDAKSGAPLRGERRTVAQAAID